MGLIAESGRTVGCLKVASVDATPGCLHGRAGLCHAMFDAVLRPGVISPER